MAELLLRPNSFVRQQCSQYPASGYHHDKVNEVVADDDTTYIYEPPSGQYDLYGLPNHTTESGVITKVTLYGRFKRSISVGYLGAALVHKTGGSLYQTHAYASSTWGNYSREYTTNSKTGLAWTWDDIDNLQIGCSLGSSTYSVTGYCTQLYAIITYTPISYQVVGVGSIQSSAFAIGELEKNTQAVGTVNLESAGVLVSIAGKLSGGSIALAGGITWITQKQVAGVLAPAGDTEEDALFYRSISGEVTISAVAAKQATLPRMAVGADKWI